MDPVTARLLLYAASVTLITIAYAAATVLHLNKIMPLLSAAVATIPIPPLPLIGESTAPRGGGDVPGMEVRNWLSAAALPVMSQRSQLLPAGSEHETWFNDCGETCCSMVIAACRGVVVPPDVLRVRATGVMPSGLTTATDLANILRANNVDSHILSAPGTAGIAAIRAAIEDRRCVLALGTWPTPGGVLHWLLVDGLDDIKVYYLNPWGGAKSWLRIADWGKYTADTYVIVDTHFLFDMHTATA